MSRHNRDRRRMKCHKCGLPMHRAVAAAGLQTGRAFARSIGKTFDSKIVHVCGGCRTCHFLERDGMRELTPAELFDCHMKVPHLMAQVETAVFEPTTVPTGTLILGTR